jgi:hypothetical protein
MEMKKRENMTLRAMQTTIKLPKAASTELPSMTLTMVMSTKETLVESLRLVVMASMFLNPFNRWLSKNLGIKVGQMVPVVVSRLAT